MMRRSPSDVKESRSPASVEEIFVSVISPPCQRGLTSPADPPPKLYKLCTSGPTYGPDLYNLYNLGGATRGSGGRGGGGGPSPLIGPDHYPVLSQTWSLVSK